MKNNKPSLASVLDTLESIYGVLHSPSPTDPFEMIVFTICGYPASDVSCAKAFAVLKDEIGLRPDDILAAADADLARIMRLGGIVPEVRALRLKEIASMVKDEFNGDLHSAVRTDLGSARKILKQFPTIGDPGADKILLFSRTFPIAAAPSNCLEVPLRLGFGETKKSYSTSYKSAREAIGKELPTDFDQLIRAYLLLKRHGREICKRSRPRCEICAVSGQCAYFRKSQA